MNGVLGSDTFRVDGGTDLTLNGFNAAGQSIEKWVGNGHGVLGNGGANTFDFGGLASVSGLAFVDGAGGNDTMTGSAFRDVFRGGAGNDAMNGGAGNDQLAGGLGADHLTGGLGPDLFDFDATAEIGKKKGLLDIITDFAAGEDKIDLSTIDANGSKKGDPIFKFLKSEGSSFTHKAGQLIWDQIDKAGTANDVTLVKGDTDGNGRADFQIELTGLIDLQKADLVL
jgi:serralysin